MLLGDRVTHSVNIAEVERHTNTFIHLPGKKGAGGGIKFRCCTARRGVKFPDNNFDRKIPEILAEVKTDDLILQAPTNDISNVSELINKHGTVDGCNVNIVNDAAMEYSWTMVKLAEIVIKKYPNVYKVIIIKRPPYRKGESFANTYLEQVVEDTQNNKVITAKHNLETLGLIQEQIFGSTSDRFNGINIYGPKGQQS